MTTTFEPDTRSISMNLSYEEFARAHQEQLILAERRRLAKRIRRRGRRKPPSTAYDIAA